MAEPLFRTVPIFRTGYDRQEVDQYFHQARSIYEGVNASRFGADDVQAQAFDLVRGGYDSHEVDAALDRLASAFVARHRADYITKFGTDAWMVALAERAKTLYPRLARPAKQRFARADKGTPGYNIDDVDALCDRLSKYFDQQGPLSAADIRGAIFRTTIGRGGYAEGPVDAFLARAVEVLLGVE
ncbi:MAG: DivIVA domain-containing protein [Promicromonosporaceae bacterium]|nr:DivIVA domain-containing protein [Promicromonosporaceae bacterium]